MSPYITLRIRAISQGRRRNPCASVVAGYPRVDSGVKERRFTGRTERETTIRAIFLGAKSSVFPRWPNYFSFPPPVTHLGEVERSFARLQARAYHPNSEAAGDPGGCA
jgi:hypothetical protein